VGKKGRERRKKGDKSVGKGGEREEI